MVNIFDQMAAESAKAGKTEPEQSLPDSPQAEHTDEPERTPQRLREAFQALLKEGLLEQVRKPNLYRTAMLELPALNELLEPLDFQARVDDVRGLVFLQVLRADQAGVDEDWTHPLIHRQRLGLEQSLLLAILRQHFVHHEQEAGVGDTNAWVAVDELVSGLGSYFGDGGSESKERNRVVTLLNQLKTHGVVSDPDQHGRVQIRPIIAHLANPDSLQALLQFMREQQTGAGQGEQS